VQRRQQRAWQQEFAFFRRQSLQWPCA
jgi:hypothetical protein